MFKLPVGLPVLPFEATLKLSTPMPGKTSVAANAVGNMACRVAFGVSSVNREERLQFFYGGQWNLVRFGHRSAESRQREVLLPVLFSGVRATPSWFDDELCAREIQSATREV